MKDIRDLEDKELIDEFEFIVNSSEGLHEGEIYQAFKAEILRRMESRIY